MTYKDDRDIAVAAAQDAADIADNNFIYDNDDQIAHARALTVQALADAYATLAAHCANIADSAVADDSTIDGDAVAEGVATCVFAEMDVLIEKSTIAIKGAGGNS